MKKFVCAVLIFCVMLSGAVVFAKAAEDGAYNVSYNTGCDSVVQNTVADGGEDVVEVSISKSRPRREGFDFLGWSFSEQDYSNTDIIQPGEKIEISSSVVLYALWQDKNPKKVSYMDGSRTVLPTQFAESGKARVSEMIPQKSGYVFAGWSYSIDGKTEILLPGDEIDVEGPVVLIACWEQGEVSLPELRVSQGVDSSLIFVCDNADDFDEAILEVKNPVNEYVNTYAFREGGARVDDLSEGAYVARVVAEKYGVEYKSHKKNVVVASDDETPAGPLTVFMDGKELTFDLPPVLLDGHTFVTLRYFCEYLGSDVVWDDENRTAIITYNGTRVKVKENSDVCVVNGTSFQLPAKTVLMSSKMFIPLRSVAEFCNCEVIWDPSQKVYMFSENVNVFDKNIYTISGNNGKYLSVGEDGLRGRIEADFDSMWIFDAVDAEKGIYEIYNFADMQTPLEVKTSKYEEGRALRIWEKSGFDGYLWKVTPCGEGEYFIQGANHPEFYLDAVNMCITTDETKVFLEGVYR